MAILACSSSSPRVVPLAAVSVGAPYPVSLAPVPYGPPPMAVTPPRQLFPHWLDREPGSTPQSAPSSTARSADLPTSIVPVSEPARVEILFDAADLPFNDGRETADEMRARFDAECAAFQQFEAMYLDAVRARARAYYRRHLSPEVLALLADEEAE